MGCKWVYRRKEGIPGVQEARFKARLVAKGYTQREGEDFFEIFSPVVRHTSIRTMMSLVVQFDMELEQLDVKTAFLHGNLDERIYMVQLQGYELKGSEDKVCFLQKSLYGPKQAPRQWYLKFDSFMISKGFKRSYLDNCVYTKLLDEGSSIHLLLYVDDMLIASVSKLEVQRIKKLLNEEFDMKDLGKAKRILGMDISRDIKHDRLFLSQEGYIRKVLKRFEMLNSKSVGTPLAAHFKLSLGQAPSTEEEKQQMKRTPYTYAVGSIMSAMVCSRPDLAHAASVISRFVAYPGLQYWKAVKWVLRYLNGTSGFGLEYRMSQDIDAYTITGLCDSDHAGDLDRRRSCTGYVFKVFGNVVSWKTSLQSVVALSSTDAEYMALADATKEALWLSGLVKSFGIKVEQVQIKSDSQSAISLTKNHLFHDRTKHISVRYHFIRDIIERGKVVIGKVQTDDNCADALTKVVTVQKFQKCLSLIGMSEFTTG